MEQNKKSIRELIIDVLRDGETHKLSDITAMISEMNSQVVKLTDISSVVTKIVNKSDLGHFIATKKLGRASAYVIVKEALNLAPEEMYGLSLKTGQNRFTLEAAIAKYPALQKFVKKADTRKSGEGRKVRKVKAAKVVERSTEEMRGDTKAGDPILIKLFRELVESGLRIEVNVNVRVH